MEKRGPTAHRSSTDVTMCFSFPSLYRRAPPSLLFLLSSSKSNYWCGRRTRIRSHGCSLGLDQPASAQFMGFADLSAAAMTSPRHCALALKVSISSLRQIGIWVIEVRVVRETGLHYSGLNNDSADSEKDGFFEMTNVRLPDTPNTLATVGSREACELACSSNCSCNAYSYNDSGCFVWHGGLLNLQEQYNQSDAGGCL